MDDKFLVTKGGSGFKIKIPVSEISKHLINCNHRKRTHPYMSPSFAVKKMFPIDVTTVHPTCDLTSLR
jgi:hypothetical protein